MNINLRLTPLFDDDLKVSYLSPEVVEVLLFTSNDPTHPVQQKRRFKPHLIISHTRLLYVFYASRTCGGGIVPSLVDALITLVKFYP